MPGIDSLVPDLRPWATALGAAAAEAGLFPRFTSFRRSFAQQSRLYRRYLAGLTPYPVAPPGRSAHELGLAFDLVVSPMEGLSDLGSLWQSWGGVWGADRDPIHFEAPGASQRAAKSKSFAYIADAVDLIIAFIPGIGEAELVAELLHLGFPQSKIAEFFAGPFAYLVK